MKIINSPENSLSPQDLYDDVKISILLCPFDLSNLEVFNDLLKVLIRKVKFEDTFNLRLWIDVLNKVDEILLILIESINKYFLDGDKSRVDDCVGTVKNILLWSTKLLQNSFNKYVYNSSNVIFFIIIIIIIYKITNIFSISLSLLLLFSYYYIIIVILFLLLLQL
jgi:hypothetical protein